MSAAAAAAPIEDSAPTKPKRKKLLFILIGVAVLALLGAGGALYVIKKNAAAAEEGLGGEGVAAAHEDAHRTPPTFLPLDSMVVNLADPGGNRFVQMAITLQLDEAKTGEDIKVYMPSIRNGILMLTSQRTAEQILQVQGKEELARDIVKEISRVMGYALDKEQAGADGADASHKKPRRPAEPNPLQGVLFSSFIVQ
jgi:flagellar protein FliL